MPPPGTVTTLRKKDIGSSGWMRRLPSSNIKGPPLSTARSAIQGYEPIQGALKDGTDGSRPNNRYRRGAAVISPAPTTSRSQADSFQTSLTSSGRSSTIKSYSVVSGEPKAASTFETLTRVEASTANPSFTQTDPPSAFATIVPSQHPYKSSVPDPPFYLIYLVVGFLTAGLAAAILLYFVNFPPSLKFRRHHKGRHQYFPVAQNALDTSSSPAETRDGPAITTSADTPTLLARRRRQQPLTVDTTATYQGLGIAFSADDPTSNPSSSYERSNYLTPSIHHHPLTAPLPHARTNPSSPPPIRNTSGCNLPAYELQHLHPALEEGLSRPTTSTMRLTPGILSSPSLPSSPLPSKVQLLERVGEGIEVAAEKFARLLHDRVRGAPEEGLLLSVRGGGSAQWKKVC